MNVTVRTQWQMFLIAMGFFTRGPIPTSVTFTSERSACWWGWLVRSPSIAIGFSMVATVLLTGAFHEDGQAPGDYRADPDGRLWPRLLWPESGRG